jgi:hypothetical protein
MSKVPMAKFSTNFKVAKGPLFVILSRLLWLLLLLYGRSSTLNNQEQRFNQVARSFVAHLFTYLACANESLNGRLFVAGRCEGESRLCFPSACVVVAVLDVDLPECDRLEFVVFIK